MRQRSGFYRRQVGKSRRSAKRLLCHVEQLESRAVLSAESAVFLPPPSGASDAADATRAVIAPISPVAATGLRLIVPPQARAGVPTIVTAWAVDSAGRLVTSFSGSATVSSSDSAASLPLVSVLFRNGRASFGVTFATAGAQTVSVTTLTYQAMTATASTSVTAAPTLTSFLVVMPRPAVAGTPVNVSIVAFDAANRPIPGFTGTAALTSSDSAATLPSSVTFANGRATARVTFATPGSQSITVRGGVASGSVVASATTEVIGTPVAVGFSILLPRAVAVGLPVRVNILAVDAQGRPLPRFSGTATLSSSDTAATLPSSVTFINGLAVARLTFGTLGEQTLTVTSGPSTGGGISGSARTMVGEVVTQRIRTLPVARP